MAGTRLELTWVGKEERPRLEPRILLEDREKSHHAAARRSDSDIFDNMLIHGDNLLALKALEQDFRGKVKCVYIDPPPIIPAPPLNITTTESNTPSGFPSCGIAWNCLKLYFLKMEVFGYLLTITKWHI